MPSSRGANTNVNAANELVLVPAPISTNENANAIELTKYFDVPRQIWNKKKGRAFLIHIRRVRNLTFIRNYPNLGDNIIYGDIHYGAWWRYAQSTKDGFGFEYSLANNNMTD